MIVKFFSFFRSIIPINSLITIIYDCELDKVAIEQHKEFELAKNTKQLEMLQEAISELTELYKKKLKELAKEHVANNFTTSFYE